MLQFYTSDLIGFELDDSRHMSFRIIMGVTVTRYMILRKNHTLDQSFLEYYDVILIPSNRMKGFEHIAFAYWISDTRKIHLAPPHTPVYVFIDSTTTIKVGLGYTRSISMPNITNATVALLSKIAYYNPIYLIAGVQHIWVS